MLGKQEKKGEGTEGEEEGIQERSVMRREKERTKIKWHENRKKEKWKPREKRQKITALRQQELTEISARILSLQGDQWGIDVNRQKKGVN